VTVSRLNIAHFYQDGGLHYNEPQAAQLHIYHTIRGLQQAGHSVTLHALQGRRVICTQDLRVFSRDPLAASDYGQLGRTGTALFKLAESSVRRIQAETHLPYLALFDSYRMAETGRLNLRGIDLIHERFNLLGLGGYWASRLLKVPYVLEVNADLVEQRSYKGTPERGLRRLFAVYTTGLCLKAAARVVCISEGLRDHLRNRWQLDPSKLTVLPCAADVALFGQSFDTSQIRRELGLADEPVVMWIGGFYPWHALDLLLESFAQVLHGQPNTRLILVGDGQTRQAIADKIVASGLRQAVIMTGAIPHRRVPDMLSIADVAVVPAAPVGASRGGTGTPLKLFEYMAAGKAIVATGITQAAAVIRDGQTGRLVNAGDVTAFADAVLQLLRDSTERQRLGHNARREAVERHSWEVYTRQLEETYFDILRSAPSARPSAGRVPST
jgi:glycosyltransferase involved in cell wall biosynthesis